MFKLESYITPILLDYVSKYVKDIRQEDFQLSLWEGEVALHNLDLRLDVLQEELNLPVEFISGHIHDLSIRVPWTKITSEPIVITINTIEFVLKLKNPREDGAGSSASSSPQRINEAKKKRKCPPKPEERGSNPEASSSWLISKIINNISLQCHNIILKYVEEDIVVSMNVQLLSFGSANEKWSSAMIDVHPIKVLMRKLIKISDLTICLDKRNAAGQIDVCQEPILYRSSFECRVLLKYNANNPETNRITRIAVFTSLLDMNISSMQIPLCLRLLKLAIALKEHKITKVTTPDAPEDCVEEDEETPADQSYLSWAWNLLPSINFTPGYEDEPTNEAPCHTIDFGFYAEQLSFTLKNAEFTTDTHVAATKRIRYSPIVRLVIGGMYFEMVSAAARRWNSFKAGVTSICVEPLGAYKKGSSNIVESEESQNQRPFIDKSLFDDQCQSIADKGWGVTNYDEYVARITDDYLLYRSPVLAFDLIQYKATSITSSSSSTKTENDESGNRVQYRFLTAGLTFRYSQTLEQVKQLICEFINSYDYPAYYTESLDGGSLQTAGNGNKLPPAIMEDYDELMKHIPLCTYRVSIQRLTVEIHAKGELDVLTHRSQTKRGAFKAGAAAPPYCVFYMANAEGLFSTPLQPDKLVHTTCQLPEKPEKLLEACYESYELHIKEFSCILLNQSEDRRARIFQIPHIKFDYGKLLQPHNWKDDLIDIRKLNINCEQIVLEFTRRELNSIFYLAQCTFSYKPQALRRLIRLEATDLTVEDNTKLNSNLSKMKIRWQLSSKQNNWNFTLLSLESHVLYRQRFEMMRQLILSTTATKRHTEATKWLECNILFPCEDVNKQRASKTIVGIWLGPFTIKIDANLLQFLRCRKFEELDRETVIESIIQTQILSIPNVPSNLSLKSQTSFVTPISTPQPPMIRRSSRNSLQSRKISHPEETIHLSSERDDKPERDTASSISPKAMESSSNPAWLDFIKSYIFYVEMETSTINIAKNLENDAIFTKIVLPRVLLKPSNLETTKNATLRQLVTAITHSKDKSNINWSLIFSDFGIVNVNGTTNEALLEPMQTTITIALTHKSEKLKTTTTDKEGVKEENEIQAQIEKSPVRRDSSTLKPAIATAQTNRPISPSEVEFSSTGSVTVGGRSEKSLTDLIQTEMQISTQTALDNSKAIAKQHQKRTRKNREIFTFNLHADTTPIRFVVSSRKIRLFEEHFDILLKIIQLTTPISQPNSCEEIPEERIEIVTATEENAALKEFMDLETSSESSKFSEKENEPQLIISLFCQWTITRITLEIEANPLNYNSSKVIVDLEDLLSTVDHREDYTKCTSKIGNLNVTYFEENMNGGDWIPHDSLTIRLLGETTNLPFLNVVYTSVGLKHFFKRIGAKRKGDLNRNLTEVIITIQALEIIVNLERISKFVAALSGFFERCAPTSNETEQSRISIDGRKNKITYPIAAADLPMIHLDSKGFTLYMPLDKGRDCCSVSIFRIESIKITPNLENPLQRKPLRPDVFAKAAQLGMLGTPGSIVEDRQYELTLRNVSAASGSWRQILVHMSEQRDNFFRTNPAFEWNNQNRKPELHITDIFSNFTFIAIYAPSIVYQNVLICGSNTEFNCATDFVASLNMYQINMLSCLIVHLQRILCFIQSSKKQKRVSLTTKSARSSSIAIKPDLSNSNIFSVKSSSFTLQRCSTHALLNVRDVRSSSVFNSIDEDTEHNVPTTSDSGFQSSNSHLAYAENIKEKFGSISTLSSAPISSHLRHIPKTLSLVAGVFLIKFYDVQMNANTDSDVYDDSCRLLRTPLFSITLSQPSFIFTQNVYDSIMQVSLYDFYIYLASTNPVGPISHLVFNEVILDTRPGQANAAGITPPLFSLRRNCTKLQLRECDIEFAKPIALLLSEEKVTLLCRHILLINATLLEDPCFDVRPKRSILRGSKMKLMRQQFFATDRLHFICRSIVVRFQSEKETYNCKLVSSDMKFNMKFLNRPEKATAKASISALYLLVDQKAIVHPINMRISFDLISEPWHPLPLITATIKVNMLQLDIGINSVIHLQEACKGYKRLQQNLNLQWKHFLRNRPFEKDNQDMKDRNLELLKCPSDCELMSTSSRTSVQREEFYQDDLRAGAFQFVEMSTDSFLPMPYQIQIIKKNFGIICWRYPQPRKMSRIHVYPVPMAMPNPIHIRCRMEYYSETHETFLNFCEFSLSETVSKQVQLPERHVCANIWRVVILQSLISVNGACFDDMISEDDESLKSISSIKIDEVLNGERKESDFILHPKVLVGCMRIDTTFESKCVPKVQLLLSCNFVTVKLLNQPNQGGVLPKLLKKFKLAQTTQISQAFVVACLQNLNLYARFMSPDNYTIDSSGTCSVKCLDYGFLNMLYILEDTTLQSFLGVETKASERDISVKLVLNRLKLNFGPSIVHSLLSSKQHWEEYLQANSTHHALVPKCIIVNRTFTTLTFGQTGTSERIQLQNRESCLYSFRSFYHGQDLTVFIADFGTGIIEASTPVSISFKFDGEVLVQPVRVGKHCLIVKSRKISPMQIYVLIKGQVELVSMVPHEFRLDFRQGQDKKSFEYQIEEFERACFYYAVQQKSNINLRLRFADNVTGPKTRSGDIPLRSNKNLPWLVKVPLPNVDFISFWVRIFRENIFELTNDNFKPQKILITIWPIFEICSMLSTKIQAEEETTGEYFELSPGGKSLALDVPATHLTDHRIKFNFDHPISQKSSDEFVLTLKMIDWKQFFWYNEAQWSIEDVLEALSKGHTTKFPYNDEEELRIQRLILPPEIPAIQYSCLPSRELSCTLQLEISPWGYFINATSMSISLCLSEMKKQRQIVVGSNALQMLPEIEKSFTIEITNGTNWLSSAPIFFEENVNDLTTSKVSQYYVLSEATHVDIVILRGEQILKFVLYLKIEHNRKILTLRSKYVIANFTKHQLCLLPFAMDHKDNAMREHVQNLDTNALKRELPPVKSNDECIGIALDTFHDLHAHKSKCTIDTALVFFVSFKICIDSSVSIPIPLSLPFTRRCFSAQNGKKSLAFAVTLIEEDAIYYLSVFNDTSPALLVDNQTDMTFLIAQTNASENSKVTSTTPEFIGRHFEWFQLLPSHSSCYYTPPEMYANFPDVESAVCNLTLAIHKDNITKKEIKWSKPIRTDKSWEKFLHVPNHGDVKVIICDKHRIIRVSIYYILQQKEFSVKDLRTRLLVKQPTFFESNASFGSLTTQQNSPIAIRSTAEATQHCVHFPSNQLKTTIKNRFKLHTYVKEIIFCLHIDDKERDYIKMEVLSAYVDDFMLVYDNTSSTQTDGRFLDLLFPNLQIDNQLHSTGKFDFPVIICAQKLYQKTNFIPQTQYLECIYKELYERSPMALISLKFFDDEFSISDLTCSFSPLRAYVEDGYLNELLDALVECVPSNCLYFSKVNKKRLQLNTGQTLVPQKVAAQAICIAEPLQLRSFRIEPLNILLSVHTSLRLYIALDHSPLSFSSYQRQQILTVPLRFGQSLGMHYLSGAIFGAGWVVGSLEILGSPSGMARSFLTGLRDFVSMPMQGLFRGPWGFIIGITQGSASLLRNVTAGTVNSLTKLAASVARNLDRLSLDREHIERTEALRRTRPNSLTEGFSQGLTGLGISILGAVGGIAHHTLEARSTVEVVTGVGKGLVGAFTKPISGAAELVALTGQGVLQTVGFNAMPLQRVPSLAHNQVNEPSAYRIWMLLPNMLITDQVLFYHEITLAIQKQLRFAYVFLTSTYFAILVAQCDKLELAYPVNKIALTRDREDKMLFYIHFDKEDADEMEDNVSYTNERIMNFLRSSHSIRDSSRISTGSLQELLQGPNEEQDIVVSYKNLDWAFYINENLGEHLMQYLKILRNET